MNWLDSKMRVLKQYAKERKEKQVAPYHLRIIASMIDFTIVGGASVMTSLIMLPFFNKLVRNDNSLFVDVSFSIIIIGSTVVIPFFMAIPWMCAREGNRNGSTVGRAAVGIILKREDRTQFTFKTAFFRETVFKLWVPLSAMMIVEVLLATSVASKITPLIFVASMLTVIGIGASVYLVIIPLLNSRGLALHDKWAKTYMTIDHERLAARAKKNSRPARKA